MVRAWVETVLEFRIGGWGMSNEYQAQIDPWSATAVVGRVDFGFDAIETVVVKAGKSTGVAVPKVATVGIRRNLGGFIQRADLAGRFTPADDGFHWIHQRISSDLQQDDFASRITQNRLLAVGLPAEFAQPVLETLTEFEPGLRPEGRIEVMGARFDIAGSSRNIFRSVARLLKMVLLHDGAMSAVVLSGLLERETHEKIDS